MNIMSFVLFFLAASMSQGEQLIFREDWKESPPELPLSQNHVAHPSLVVTLHGPGLHGIKKSHHDWIEGDPYYVWSGACPGNWAVSLRHRDYPIDLTGDAKIRWCSKQAGFRQLRIILRLTSGPWLVSDASDDASADWRIREFRISDLRWRQLDITRISEQEWVEKPDLSRVAEVGFTDLMPGGLSSACSRLDWIEVYGSPAR